MSKYMKTPRSKFSSEQGDCKFWKKLSYLFLFFSCLDGIEALSIDAGD